MSNKSSANLFEKYLSLWDHHHAMNNFSVPQREGAKAILYSTNVGYVGDFESEENAQVLESFEREANEIAGMIRGLGGKALIYSTVTPETFSRVLDDRQISDIVVIGNGGFSDIYSDESTYDLNSYITWVSVARFATHLKQGAFVQRTCGKFLEENRLSPPFGTFAVSDHRHIFSPVNEYFNPDNSVDHTALQHEERKIRQVSSVGRISLAYANTHFRGECIANQT